MNVNRSFRAEAKNGALDGEITEDAIENWLKFKHIRRQSGASANIIEN
jgi:hypothetical protein